MIKVYTVYDIYAFSSRLQIHRKPQIVVMESVAKFKLKLNKLLEVFKIKLKAD